MKKLSTFLIIAGILIALVPVYNYVYTWYWQNEALESYEALDTVFLEEPENTATGPIVEDPNENIYFPPELQTPNDEELTRLPNVEQTTTATSEAKPIVKPKAIGILEIGKIKLKLPIFSGATNSNMKIGVGWMKETSPIGKEGNAALAAHRSHTYGRFFNRLDELEVNDTFSIYVGNEEYKYVIFKKIVVEPSDVSVLNRTKGEEIVTLITCTPFITATHRLIIQAKRF